jgi:hypothetical protein
MSEWVLAEDRKIKGILNRLETTWHSAVWRPTFRVIQSLLHVLTPLTRDLAFISLPVGWLWTRMLRNRMNILLASKSIEQIQNLGANSGGWLNSSTGNNNYQPAAKEKNMRHFISKGVSTHMADSTLTSALCSGSSMTSFSSPSYPWVSLTNRYGVSMHDCGSASRNWWNPCHTFMMCLVSYLHTSWLALLDHLDT